MPPQNSFFHPPTYWNIPRTSLFVRFVLWNTIFCFFVKRDLFFIAFFFRAGCRWQSMGSRYTRTPATRCRLVYMSHEFFLLTFFFNQNWFSPYINKHTGRAYCGDDVYRFFSWFFFGQNDRTLFLKFSLTRAFVYLARSRYFRLCSLIPFAAHARRVIYLPRFMMLIFFFQFLFIRKNGKIHFLVTIHWYEIYLFARGEKSWVLTSVELAIKKKKKKMKLEINSFLPLCVCEAVCYNVYYNDVFGFGAWKLLQNI